VVEFELEGELRAPYKPLDGPVFRIVFVVLAGGFATGFACGVTTDGCTVVAGRVFAGVVIVELRVVATVTGRAIEPFSFISELSTDGSLTTFSAASASDFFSFSSRAAY
jgi:hypothetical protein